jgi:SAM-dependent methyltransferase
MHGDAAGTGRIDGAGEPRRERWQLTGGTAEAYERYLVPLLFAPWGERLVERAAPGPGERVLDVACGTGILARQAADRVGPGGAVAGVDLNQGMLDVARAAAAGGPPIRWHAGDAAGLPVPDGAFDVVLCQQGVQFFPDPAAALREMRRVLAPGGRVAVSVWRDIRHCPGFGAMADALERHAGADVAAIMRAPFAFGGAERLRGLLAGAGFTGARVRIDIGAVRPPSAEEFLRRQAAASPLAGPVGALDDDRLAAVIRDLDDRLREHTDDDGVAFPMEATVATARAPA